jgi:hypothetical protein
MEAVRTSETPVDNHFTQQYIPEDNSDQKNVTVKFLCLTQCIKNWNNWPKVMVQKLALQIHYYLSECPCGHANIIVLALNTSGPQPLKSWMYHIIQKIS